jgi:hypothetical protein
MDLCIHPWGLAKGDQICFPLHKISSKYSHQWYGLVFIESLDTYLCSIGKSLRTMSIDAEFAKAL